MRSARLNKSGFTLIELLVVIAVIMVILGIAIPIGQRARLNAVETVVVREVQTIGQAADLFEVSSEAYFPTDAPRPTVRVLTRRFHPTLDKNRKRLEVLPAL